MVLFAIKYALDRQVVRGPIKKARSTPTLLLRIHPKGTEFAHARDNHCERLSTPNIRARSHFVRAPCVLRGRGSALDFSRSARSTGWSGPSRSEQAPHMDSGVRFCSHHCTDMRDSNLYSRDSSNRPELPAPLRSSEDVGPEGTEPR